MPATRGSPPPQVCPVGWQHGEVSTQRDDGSSPALGLRANACLWPSASWIDDLETELPPNLVEFVYEVPVREALVVAGRELYETSRIRHACAYMNSRHPTETACARSLARSCESATWMRAAESTSVASGSSTRRAPSVRSEIHHESLLA